jgi:hypothetical protein
MLQLQRLASHAHRVIVQPVQVGLLAQPWRRTRPGSLLRQHFLHYFSGEIPIAEGGIRTAENSPHTRVNRGIRKGRGSSAERVQWT